MRVKVVAESECWECTNPWARGEVSMAVLQRRIRRSRSIRLCEKHSQVPWIVGYWSCVSRGGKHKAKDDELFLEE